LLTNILKQLSSTLKNVSMSHSARTAIAATCSLAIAEVFKMHEAYWAPISAIIVMQSTLGAAWAVSKQRFTGTIVGAAFGGLLASYFEIHLLLFGVAIFVLGIICLLLHLDQSAYRFAGVTFTIITLITRGETPWLIGFHRFVEVSLGIAVAISVTILWPEPRSSNADS